MPVYMPAHNHIIASHVMQIAIGAGISEGAMHGGLESVKGEPKLGQYKIWYMFSIQASSTKFTWNNV